MDTWKDLHDSLTTLLSYFTKRPDILQPVLTLRQSML
uniref:Uncharacterized protein n=1 Tax=Arundo donax TaxID=35708 RepID=A0A0A9CDF0_ARUDO